MSFFDEIDRYGADVALITEEGQRIVYAELVDAADRLRARLRGPGLAFLLAKNCPESVMGYIGFLRARIPVVLQPPGLHPELLANLLDTYRPRYVWLPRERAEQVPASTELFALGKYVLVSRAADPVVLHEDMALLLSTSGSTGSPKLVRQSYQNIAANAASIAQYLDIGSEDRAITTLPMHYVFGLSVLNSHLLRGATIVLTDRGLMERGFWELMKTTRATSFAGVPYTFEMLRRLRFARMDLPSLRVLSQAGGKLDAALVHEFASICHSKGMRFYVMYGAAEATARMSYLPPQYALEKPGSIGIPIPGGEFWIEDSTGAVIESPDMIGELIYRGDNVTFGYATCREDLARGDERGGVLRTGDMARRDEDGFYYIVGRRNRFIKIFGNRINLEEIEQHIRKTGADCACAGKDDNLRIYIADGLKKDKVMTFVQELTGLHHSAYTVVVLDEIPRNEFGKITYAALP